MDLAIIWQRLDKFGYARLGHFGSFKVESIQLFEVSEVFQARIGYQRGGQIEIFQIGKRCEVLNSRIADLRVGDD